MFRVNLYKLLLKSRAKPFKQNVVVYLHLIGYYTNTKAK